MTVDPFHKEKQGRGSVPSEQRPAPIVSRASRLADALQRARAREEARAFAAQNAQAGALSKLAIELSSIADELPALASHADVGSFEGITSQAGDRLIVDPLTHIEFDTQTRRYKLIRQRREGQETVLESGDRHAVAEEVADHIAKRIVEREVLLGAAPQTMQPVHAPSVKQKRRAQTLRLPRRNKRFSRWQGFWLFVLGAVCAALALLAWAWFSYPLA